MGKSHRQGLPEKRDGKVIPKEDRRGRKRSQLYNGRQIMHVAFVRGVLDVDAPKCPQKFSV
ncbi:hypothetical protein BACFIN_05644 [Bacteroides finegoldii DSM 17565]|nr:hypothetical protein BACFIN_05644 [Bacteroides finegoldii DSM 17565]